MCNILLCAGLVTVCWPCLTNMSYGINTLSKVQQKYVLQNFIEVKCFNLSCEINCVSSACGEQSHEGKIVSVGLSHHIFLELLLVSISSNYLKRLITER